ncbi:MAG: hypothetical protein GFH27_549289n350 [Chloroflexi bacterium AL-W]|nr:hypothetical protein [Chloroflexi bacterium AL-N1]NOK67082.1 hypothetical protein [Chloroflexi bacterium AL-N10]NOK74625.1 hypothetical protein [Chloroflexi bacterium AL-N5]NOK81684.1 hypothetical protein [Chloroflexi bacterium AL-W]NOK89154.1 hypothetical protein [Chloroflexi bacterium AL-N15]
MASPQILLPYNTNVGGLGYRGFVIRQLENEDSIWQQNKLPSIARIGRNLTLSADAADLLLESAEETTVDVPDDVLEVTEAAIEEDRQTKSDEPSLSGYTKCSQGYYTSDSDFSFWNGSSSHQLNNNCYNYAANSRTNTFAQPGRASGQMFSTISCADVGAAAVRDGWQSSCRSDNNLQTCLVIWPGMDYHWYRLCINNHWCHKAGQTPARNTDDSGQLITDPETCNRGPYTDFCGYYRGLGLTVS